jgi:hypothetical protein
VGKTKRRSIITRYEKVNDQSIGEFCKTLSFAIINRTGMINGSVTQVRNIMMRLSDGPNINETIILAIIARETTSKITAMKVAKKCKNVINFVVLSE